MNNTVVICVCVSALTVLLLLVFALFAIGFLIGYKFEDNKILKKSLNFDENIIYESDEEKKIKKDWKNFLNYDGSTPK